MNTRIYYDDARTIANLEQDFAIGQWIINAPGNGLNMPFIDDPAIRMQKWGANFSNNAVNVDCMLKGLGRPSTIRDCFTNNYQNFNVPLNQNSYPILQPQPQSFSGITGINPVTGSNLSTEQSRATNPAWWYKDLPQNLWGFPQLPPQENVCYPFHNNLSTRILEKDYFEPRRECFIKETSAAGSAVLPVNFVVNHLPMKKM